MHLPDGKPRLTSLPRYLMGSLWLLVLAVAFKSLNRLETDYDLWWQIFMGQETISRGAIVYNDIYSFTVPGQSIFNHEWLAQIMMAGAFGWFGDIGLIAWRWGLILGILLLSYRLIRKKAENSLTPVVVFLCIAVVLSPGASFRPHLFTYLLIIVLLNLMEGFPRHMPFRRILLVCGLFIGWANIHGGFVLGLVLWFIYAGGRMVRARHSTENLRFAILTAGLPAVVTIINPYGYRLWWYIWEELGNPLSGVYITEWQRFSFAPRELPFVIFVVVAWGAFMFSKRDRRLEEAAVLTLATLMGLVSVRHTPLFALVTLPAVAWHMDGVMVRFRDKRPLARGITPGVGIGAAVVLLAGAFFFVRLGFPDQWNIRPGKDTLPHHSVAFLQENGLKGNLWVPLHWGGYALFHLYPAIKVSIDGRWGMLYPLPVMADNMTFAYKGTGGKWKEMLARYHADYALVEVGNPALPEMLADKNWVWAYSEESGGLLIKKEVLAVMPRPIRLPIRKAAVWP